MKAPMSVLKPADLRQGVPNCASKYQRKQEAGDTMFTQVQALLMEVIPYFLLDYFDEYRGYKSGSTTRS